MLGDLVLYRTDGRGGLDYWLPAIVVRTTESADPRGPMGLVRGGHADLRVFSPGTDYVELNVSQGFQRGQWCYPWEYHERGGRAGLLGEAQPMTNARAAMTPMHRAEF